MATNRAQILITAIDQTRDALNSARSGLMGLSDVAGRVNRVLAGLGLAVSAAGLATLVKRSISAADEMAKLAQRTGVSVEFLSTLKPVAEMAGTSLDAVTRGMGRLSQTMAQAEQGSARHQALLAELGITYTDASGQLRSVDAVLLDLADTFQAMPDGPRKTALAMELFGRSGAELIPFLNQGRDGIEALQGKMRDLGLEMNTNTAKAAEAFNDALATVGYAIQGVVNRALIALTPLLESAAAGLEWLAENLDSVLHWLKLLAEVGLGVLIYRSIPAAVLAFQSLSVTAVTAAKAASAAWALASTQIAAATAALGPLKIAFLVLGALLIGWEIGKWLSERFAIVRKAGIFMVERLLTAFEYLRYGWELVLALFTSDTLAEATARHQQRLETMRGVFADMYADAERGAGAAATAVDAAGAATQQMAQQLARARQETQASLSAGIEAIGATVTAVQAEIQRLDGQIDAARKTVDTALKGIGESYKALTAEVERELTQRLAATEQHYAEQQRQLEAWTGSETVALQRAAELLKEHITGQVRLREDATARTLSLIDTEAQVRLEAIRRQGFSEEERARRTAQVEQEALVAKRQALDAALSDYRRHIDALNREAERHLDEVKRIEDEKRRLSLSTEDRIREIRRAGMSDFEAQEDRKRQIAELQTQAREALAKGELETARGFAKQAMDLAAQVASQQTSEAKRAEGERARIEQDATRVVQLEADARAAAARGEHATQQRLLQEAEQLRAELAERTRDTDRQITEGKEGVNAAIEQIRVSESLLVQALDDEARAHRTAAAEATRARDTIQGTLAATQREIDQISQQIGAGLTLAIEADISELQRALTEVESLVQDRDWLVFIEADLQAAQSQLEDFRAILARGETLPVDADVSSAQAALERLHGYAQAASRTELQMSTEAAQAAVQTVEQQVQALGRLQTESRHQVNSNADAARAEVLRLNGLNTSSTHTIYVRRVEKNAAGGVAGAALAHFAAGGPVPGFPPHRGGPVPGVGHQDTVPRALEAGAFVLRKAAAQRYQPWLRQFAGGGSVACPEVQDPAALRRAQAVAKEIERQELAIAVARAELEKTRADLAAARANPPKFRDARDYYGYWNRIESLQRAIPAQDAEIKALELELAQYREKHATRLARGGAAPGPSDTVPALLTPGEYVVPRTTVQRLGVGFLEALNHLALPTQVVAQRIQGFASGGWVAPPTRSPIRNAAFAGASATRTVRVELAAGGQQVTAQLAAQDEGRLLELLERARARAG